MAFHVDPFRIPGGFVGVDIFFVISGFLITGQIFAKLDKGEFSLIEFFARRVRRLYPALLVVLVATTGFASMLLLPGELQDYSWSLLSSLAYVSNIFFWLQTGYFDGGGDFLPLLHTWSLSVEEQFYLAFPFVCMILVRLPARARLIGLVLVGLASLAACEYMIADESNSAAFYLSPFRAWEFALGGMITLMPRVRLNRWLGEALAMGALLLLATSALWMNDGYQFPGIGALPFTLATALIIMLCREHRGLAGWLLTLAPLRAIGRASYSIYLWHWPIVVFYRLVINVEPAFLDEVAMMALSLGAGALSYRFVEMPFLSRKAGESSQRMALGAIGVSAAVALLAVPLLLTGGLPQRFTAPQLAYASYLGEANADEDNAGTCYLAEESMRFSTYPKDQCLGIEPGMPNVLLIGDSHSAHLLGALKRRFPDVHFAQANAAGCYPVLNPTGSRRCVRLFNYVFSPEVIGSGYDAVIIGARWLNFMMGEVPGTVKYISDLGPDVYVLGPTIEYALPLPRLLAFESDADGNFPSLKPFIHYDQIAGRNDALREILGDEGKFISVFDALCRDGDCTAIAPDGTPVSFDYGHFTKAGGDLVVDHLVGQGLLAGIGDKEPLSAALLD